MIPLPLPDETTRLALMAETLASSRLDLRDETACILLLIDERFFVKELNAWLTAAITIARDIRAVSRRGLFDIVNNAGGEG